MNDFIFSFRLRNTYKVNSILYSLRQLPFIKKILPQSLYSNHALKILGNVISILLETGSIFVGKFLYIVLMIATIASVSKTNSANWFVHIFVFLTFVGALLNTQMFNPTKDKYYALVLMKMDAKRYTLTNYLYFLLKMVIGFLPFTIIFGLRLKVPLIVCLSMPLFVVSCKLIYSAICLYKFTKEEKIVNENLPTPLVWSLVAVFLLLGYGLPFLGIVMNEMIYSGIFLLAITLAGVATYRIVTFDQYARIYKSLLKKDVVIFDAKEVSKKTTQKTVLGQIDNQVIITSQKSGYAYLNEIFTKRHRKILTESAKKIATIALFIIIAVILVLVFFEQSRPVINHVMLTYLPYFLFIMYFINRGTVVTQAMFMNCDHSMLSYRFYRQPQAILSLFKERLKTLIKINLIPTTVIAIGLPLILLVSGGTNDPLNYLFLAITILAMSIFFSVHYLTMYYLLQPYNVNLEMKSMTYNVISLLTYVVCYMGMDIHLPTILFGTAMTLFSIVYVIIALILVYRYAPKTFKIRP